MLPVLWLALMALQAPFGGAVRRRRQKPESEKSNERKQLLKALSSLITEHKGESRSSSLKKGDKHHLTIKDYDEFENVPKFERIKKGHDGHAGHGHGGHGGHGHHLTIEDYDEFRRNQLNKFHPSSHHHSARQGKQADDVEGEFEDFDDVEDGSGDEEEDREGRQAGNLEECETTGFETNVREECEEVSEVQCNPVTVTRYKSEIVKRCKTLVDKTCNVTYTDVPKEQCGPTQEQKCHTDFKLVTEKLYKEECHTNIQNICEEHIKVPVEVPYGHDHPPPPPPPVEVPYGHDHPPHPPPMPQPHPPIPPVPNDHLPLHPMHPMSYIGGHPPKGPPLPHHTTPVPFQYSPSPSPMVQLPPDPKHLYQTTFSPNTPTPSVLPLPSYSYNPTPFPHSSPTSSPLSEFIHRLDHLPGKRRKRDLFGNIPKGPPGFPVQPQRAEENMKLKQAIAEFLLSRNQTNGQHVIQERQVHHDGHHVHHVHHGHHDHHGHPVHHGHHGHGKVTKSDEFHHIPHPPEPSLGDDVHAHLHHHPHPPHGVPPHIKNEYLGDSLTELLLELTKPEGSEAHHGHPEPRLLHHGSPPHHHHPDQLQTLFNLLQEEESATGDAVKFPKSNDEPLAEVPKCLDCLEHEETALPEDKEHPPIITTEELPAPPGCRSIATTTCHKVPYMVANKVPYETCELVPSVKCHLVLKKVAELECTPVVEEECNDFAKEIPYLVGDEECEEVFFDDCFEIEEMVPVLVCTRTRLDTKSVFLQRGQVMRKEGEKRRKKTGKRPGKQTKKDQPRRARSIYGDGHLEEIERFYSQEGRSEQRVSGEKSLEVPKEENADSKEEKKPFVFH